MTDVVVDQKRAELPPVDPAAQIPEAVKNRSAAVDAFYAQQQNTAAPESDAPAAEPPPVQPPEEPQAAPQPPAEPPRPPEEPTAKEPDDPNWQRRYARMEGRWKQAQQTIEQMQGMLNEMGNELMHVQQAPQPHPSQPSPTYLTEQDVQNYGSDLINFTQRAAAQYVTPHLQRLEQEKEQLRRQLVFEARQRLDQMVEQAVPNYREIDANPRWHQWLRLPDMLSGRIRQTLLDEAISSANAPRVISFFNGFLAEERATGNLEPAQSSYASPRREPAVPLASLAAPGRARPASGGDASMPPDKPIYTRAQVAALYSAHRKGAYTGREAEWNRIEADLYLAQREGRYRT